VAERLSAIPGFTVVGMDAPAIDVTAPAGGAPQSIERLRAARPDLVLVALGSPKQEIWIDMVRDAIRPTVAIGVGASFDFVAGRVRRCPAWVSRAGLEWLYRLVQEPGRLWRRYLVQDAKFFGIAARTLATPRHRRTRARAPDESGA
jgi:N-acetylglucosaminyldiphosphoundecaprenol N-acetyl-beta-D-mannosaminyltransferase